MKLGVHVSVAGGVDKAVDRAVDFGCNTFQIFVSNPRGWKPTVISEDDVKTFKEKYSSAKIQNAVAHSIYLINLASPNSYLREQSIESLISGLINTDRLGLSGLVTHIGSHQGDGIDVGIERVVGSINEVLASCNTVNTYLLLENTAGAGNLIGTTFTEIGKIIREVNCEKVGICLDTAHAFESGYNLDTAEGLDYLIDEIETQIGIDKLKAIHLNDSMTEKGSNRDRHENYGQGFLGFEALDRIINHPKLKDIPFIMETPDVKEQNDITKLVSQVRSRRK
jgi:deoxyribonuclease-4